MPIDFPSSPSSGQRYDYLSKSWIWNNIYWASVGASGNISSGQLGTPVVFSGNIASGSISAFNLASGIGGGGGSLSSGSVTSGLIGDNAVTSGNIASGQVGRFQINDFNAGINLSTIRGGSKGYFAGGDTGAFVSTADKLTYSTDTTSAQTTANLSQARSSLAGVSEGLTKGYFAGGTTGTHVATTDKLTFFNDITAAQASANLPQGISELAGCSGNSTKGYFGGGYTNGTITTIYKINYTTESVSELGSTLSQPKRRPAAISEGSTKGYFTGGFSSATTYSTTDKILYSNDTCSAQTTANLSQARWGLASCSDNSTKGYFAGGFGSSGAQATADKLTYATDTTSAQTSANLSQARYGLAGCSGEGTKGYFAGGISTFNVTTADKLTYSTDTTAAQTTADLSQARQFLAGVDNTYSTVFGNNSIASGNIASGQIGKFHVASVFSSGSVTSGLIGNNAVASGNIASGQVGRFQINDFNPGTNLPLGRGGDKGYFAGGNASTGSISVIADKLTYANDTTAAQTSANLSQARRNLAGCSGEGTKGYFVGGITGGSSVTTADKLTYFTDTTTAQTSANLSQARHSLTGISQGTTKGYFAGGDTAGGAGAVATADKLTYAGDTTAAQTTANLSQARFSLAGCSGDSTKGYFAGGDTGNSAYVSTADKLIYSTDTTAAQGSANLSQARYGPAGISQGTTKGYFAGGGEGGSGLAVATADKLTYSTDITAAQTTANLSVARHSSAGISQGTTKGYFAGGFTGSSTRTVVADKLTYSTDTTAAQTSANLSQARGGLAGVGQEYNIGVFFGNNSITSGNIASGQIGQYHFSSGTTDIIVMPITSIVGETNGYFAGGSTGFSPGVALATADKLTYSTDTTTAQASANLSQARGYLAGCSGDSIKGYFAGGYDPAVLATADKLTYSNDTTTAQTTANLSQARSDLAGISEGSTKGYFAGGYDPSTVATADKLTYSNDTTVAQTTANLSQARYSLAGCDGNGTKGYFAGGLNSGGFIVATADKLTYSTDTTAAQTTANLSQARYALAGVSEGLTKGYFAGGTAGISSVTTADKLTYSTDTTAAQTTANLSQERNLLAGCSGEGTKGYFAGGTTDSVNGLATADKLTYSTDTTSAQTTANLSQARYSLAGVGQEVTYIIDPVVNSGVFGDNAVTSGNISSGQVSTFHLSDQSVSSGVIVSGVVSRFKLSNEAIYSGAIASGQIPIFSLSSGLLISSSFGNESVGSGEILSGRINSPHIASGEINSFNMVSGIVNASNRLNSGSVFNLQPSSIISGLIGRETIGTNDFINGAILSGNIASGSINNTSIGSQEIGSGNIASGQIFRFHTSSGFINSGHFGDAALSSGNFNIGCVNEYNLVSGFWVTPISQYVSGAISPYFFNNGSITFNAFRTMSYVGAGYFIGNQTGTNYIILFSTEVISSLNSANSLSRFAAAGIGGGNYNGYIAGGEYLSNVTRLAEKLIYSAGTCYLVASANLSQPREKLTGITGDGTKGYFLGGCGYPSSPDYAIADKLTCSIDTTVAQTTANLSQERRELASVSDMSTKGYAAGGFDVFTEVVTADKLTFSTDTTVAQTTANLSQARANLAGCSGEGTKGYFAGGDSGDIVATADKITYSTDTTAAQTTANLISPDQGMRGVSNGTTNGYLAYGISGVGNKITYATDTTTAYTSANLTNQNSMATIDGYTLSPNDNFNQIVISGKLTTTAANKVNSANFADNSVLSGNINSNSIFSVIGGYTPFSIRSVRSGAIPTGEIGPSHFARETLRSGNFSSGLLRLVDLLGDQIQSGNIGNRQINSGHFSSNFIVTSSMVASGSVDPSVDFAQTAELNTNFPLFDSFIFQEQCSGIKAVCISSGGRVVRAQRASGLRLPAIGVTSGTVNSGNNGKVFYLGGVGRTGTFAANSGLLNGISGFQGLPLYVGSGGNIVNLSGMRGVSSGPAFLSGNMQQQIGIAISGGLFVMPSPRITRSGFLGTLPYDI